MVMVSDNQPGHLGSAPLQFLEFPNMISAESIVKKKLKIKFATKRIEVDAGKGLVGHGQRAFMNNECGHSFPVNGNKKSDMNKSHKSVISSSGDRNLCAADSLKVKSSSSMGSHKRGLPRVGDGQMEKRRKMDRSVTQQCSTILKQLMTHPAGWVFNQPVDPVKLNIPDYFSIISEPMDLGTIKTKLAKHSYSSVDEFAADVRLTFSNAMVYNPPGNNVHLMAKELNNIFNTRWNSLETKWNGGRTNVAQGDASSGTAKGTQHLGQNGHKTSPLCVSLLPDRLMSAEEKQKLREQLLEVSMGKMPSQLQVFLKKIGFNCQKGERFEVDIETFDDETLWELKRIIRSSSGARAAKAELAKKTENGAQQSLVKITRKGTDRGTRSASGSANVNHSLNLVTSKCGSCGSTKCQCGLRIDYARASSSDLSSERSMGQDHPDAARRDCEAKSQLTSQSSKSDPDSDGAVSTLDEERICLSPQISTLARNAASGQDGLGWTPLVDVQLSPKKALRAAMLRTRFADTILKAKQKTLLDHGDKADPVKMQQEKERLERQQHEEKARIEAQIREAQAASRMKAHTELKMQREREREAARLALQKMEKTVEIDDNIEILKDLETLFRPGGHFGNNALEQLGLFMKDDYIGDEDEETMFSSDGEEEGEISF